MSETVGILSEMFVSYTGAGIHDLPLEQVCVVDLGVSQEAVSNQLLHHIMAIERPEFDGQRKSIEADLILHQDDLNQQQVRFDQGLC